MTCHWKNVVWSGDEKCGQSDAKAQRRASHQTARSASRCQHNLEKTCPQLLPQPQEGLTSHSLTHCRAPDTALYVTASWIEGGFGVSSTSESSPILDITDHFSPLRLPRFPPSSVWQGEGGQGRSTHGGAGQDKHT